MRHEALFYSIRCPNCGGYLARDYDARPWCKRCNSRFVLVDIEQAKKINTNLGWKELCIDLDKPAQGL